MDSDEAATAEVASSIEIDQIIDFLSKEPPYAAIGKVIHAGADLDSGMFALCKHYGLPHEKAWRKDIAERVKWLKANTPAPADVLDKVDGAMANRNLLAHGTWIRVKDKQGFIKHKKDDPDNLHGQIVDEDILETWRSELQNLADAIRSYYLTARESNVGT